MLAAICFGHSPNHGEQGINNGNTQLCPIIHLIISVAQAAHAPSLQISCYMHARQFQYSGCLTNQLTA